MTVVLKGLILLLYCTHNVAAFIQGTDIRITCSEPGNLPSWDKDGIPIAIEGSPTINIGFFPRITYAADQSTLELSNLSSVDAGTYTCSFAAGGSGTFTVTVDIVEITGFGCPSEDSGFAFITSTCVTANNVPKECRYIFKDYDNQQRKVCKELEKMSNSTGCSAGSIQETAGFQYTESDAAGKLIVKIRCSLLHSSTGDTVHDSRTCTQIYFIDPCCQDLEIAGYVMCVFAVIFLIIADVIICFKFLKNSKCREQKLWIVLFVITILKILGSVIWVGLVAWKVVLVLPDGDLDECCDCTHPRVFVAFMTISMILGIGLLIAALRRHGMSGRNGEEPENILKQDNKFELQRNPCETHTNETPKKTRALPDTPNKNNPGTYEDLKKIKEDGNYASLQIASTSDEAYYNVNAL